MAESISITCPHCSASFKVKNSSAFGKKVKCPQCTEPFVLKKPTAKKPTAKKHSQPKKPAKKVVRDDIFDWDDPDVDSELLDDDFDDWQDDLAGTHAAKRSTRKKKKSQAKNKIPNAGFSLEKFGLPPFITGISICLFLLNLFLFFMEGQISALFFLLTCFVAIGYFLAGWLGLALEAGRENGLKGILCLIIPFYNIYYSSVRYEQTKYSLSTFGFGVFLILISYTLTFGFQGGPRSKRDIKVVQTTSPNINHSNIKRHPHNFPNANQRERSLNNIDPHFSEITEPNSRRKFFPRPVENAQTQLTKTELSQVKPLGITWPTEGNSGLDVYSERKTASIGKVYQVSKSRSIDGKTPPGANMKFRVYLPPNIDPASPVPCVLVPPAGSNLLTGMEIDPSDQIPNPEHEPYINAGFAVVTFSLDGYLPKGEDPSDQKLKVAHAAFKNSKAGLINCMHAFLQTRDVIPGIDKNNIFIAGHSSAGTLSLLFAEHYPQIKGCLAYAPTVDLEKSFKNDLSKLKAVIPDIEEFIKFSSPQAHINSLKCPVFLFHATGDQVTSFTNTQRFASQLRAQGTEVHFVLTPGLDHYQPMIDKGIPSGIKWIKKQITKSKLSPTDPQMAAASNSTPKNTKPNNSTPEPKKDFNDGTKRKATYKVTGFDDFFENAIKSNPDFWKSPAEQKIQNGLKELVTGYSPGSVNIDLVAMTVSFEYLGSLPSDLPQKLADHFFAKSVKVAGPPLSVNIVTNTPNSRTKDSNYLTFRIQNINRIRFNRNAAPKIAEAYLRQNEHYVPDSLRINYDQKWIYIKLKGIDTQFSVGHTAAKAFSTAGLFVTQEKMDLSSADLAMGATATSSTKGSSKKMAPSRSSSTTTPQPNVKQKYIIKYGIYGGKKVKESAKRSLKGFAGVDQKSIQFNAVAKEFSFINRSPVNIAALNRALTRNKFYQVNISQEALPKTKTEPKKEKVKAGTD